MNERNELERIISMLPQRVADSIRQARLSEHREICEIRLRCDRPASLTVDGENIILPLRCTASEIRGALLALCDGSPYAYGEALAHGYIPQKNGVRCGVCPLKGAGGSIDSISSVCIRLPHEYEADESIKKLCMRDERIISTLFYSPPGEGKTTLLRSLMTSLCSGSSAKRAVVVDTRRELCTPHSCAGTLIDILYGYEKGEGIDLAVRTLSPEAIFCDEIGMPDDSEAVLAAANSGVPIIASAHAESLEMLLRRPQMARLYEDRVFLRYVGIRRKGNAYSFNINDTDTGEA